jgi:hypothetical protein
MDGNVLRDVLIQIGSFILLVLVEAHIFDFFTGGFLYKWLVVKFSRGRKVLVRVHTLIDPYFRVGKIDEGFLVYKNKAKTQKRICITNESTYRCYTVNCIDTDDEKNCIIKLSGTGISGFEAGKYDDLYVRALYKPSIDDKKAQLVLILLIVIIIGIAVSIFININLLDQVRKLGQVAAVQVV